MAVNKIEHQALERLVNRIESSRRGGNWQISTEQLAEALDLDLVTIYRTIYDNPRGVTLAGAIDGFDQDRVGELVTLLEQLRFSDAEEHLYRAGLFVPFKAGSRLSERLVNGYIRALSEHRVDWSRVAHFLERGRGYREVAWNYLSEELPVEPVAEGVVDVFLREEGIPLRGKQTFLRYLRTLRERHVLDYAVLGAPFYEDVYQYAVAQGFIRPRERESFYGRGTGAKDHSKSSPRDGSTVEWARSILGVDSSAGKREVRGAYRRQMLRYHPDLNPSGAEVAKELNSAYATLLRSISDSP